jgi:bacteriorhodopsin
MASPANAILCAVIAAAFWPLIGYALARRFVPRVLALGTAAVIGWSVHSAATLPIYLLIGFSPLAVACVGALCVLVAGFSLSQPESASRTEPALTIPLWAFLAAAMLALVPAANPPAENIR